jgi:hypothetical protein
MAAILKDYIGVCAEFERNRIVVRNTIGQIVALSNTEREAKKCGSWKITVLDDEYDAHIDRLVRSMALGLWNERRNAKK